MYCAMVAVLPVASQPFSEESHLYSHEASAGHSRLAYFAGKNIALLYRISIGALHFLSAMYLRGELRSVGIDMDERFQKCSSWRDAAGILSTPIPFMYAIVWALFFGNYGIGVYILFRADIKLSSANLVCLTCSFHLSDDI